MIAVIGATGNVGAEVLKSLAAGGKPARALVTSPAKVKERLERAECVRFVFGEPETYGPAFAGAEGLFLMRPPQIADAKGLINPAVDAAVAAGVRRIAFLSLQGAERNPVVPHYAVERHLERSGAAFTFLRAAFFMQNLATTHREDIRDGDLFIPAGSGKTAFIDVRDIAAVAVKALTEPGLENAAPELTGSEALTYFEVAEIVTEVLGRPVTYSNPSNFKFGQTLRKRGLPLPQILVMEGLYTAAKLGLAGHLTGEVRRILGRDPISFRRFVRDYARVWM